VLRAEVDAIAVGASTVLADDPLLTCRDVYRARPLTRVIFDRRLRIEPRARVFATRDDGPVIVVTAPAGVGAAPERARRLADAGATLLEVEGGLDEAWAGLGRLGIQSLLLEGGPTLHRAAFEAGLVDALRVIVTPRKLGPAGVPWLEYRELALPSLSGLRIEPCGPDVIIQGDVYRTD
jgi:diaminohydroxyphosphoribosylaminopyrimidine deaminase/5-amino-6-(5-phosphoribosylamino)uracil reductase